MRIYPYLLWLAVLDAFRMRGSLIHTVLILASTGLTFILLRGLTSGIVKDQEEALLKSPTSTIVLAWMTSGKGIPLSKSSELSWLSKHPEIVAVIPDIKKIVTARNPATSAKIVNLTLQCTVPGDPLLYFHGADVLQKGERGIVLSRAAAERLGLRFQSKPEGGAVVDPDQYVTLTVARSDAGTDNEAEVKTAVRAIINYGDASFAYAERQLMDWIEDFQQWRSVPELGWKAILRKPTVAYDEYLAFSRRALEPDDITRLTARGLTATLLRPDDPATKERRTLAGLLAPLELHVYSLRANGQRLTIPAQEVEDITDADDVVVPWVDPVQAALDGKEMRLVGVSARKRWLKPFFVHPDSGFPVGENGFVVQIAGQSPLPYPRSGILSFAGGPRVPVQIVSQGRRKPEPIVVSLPVFWPMPLVVLPGMQELGSQADLPPEVATLPVGLLANLRAVERKELLFDRDAGAFLATPQENLYYQGRFYARTLHDVPTLDSLLREAGFTTQSERTHVEEIQRYARVLRLLVQFVGSIIMISGLLTLILVLSDNTARKRGALGVLRLMGVSRVGVGIFVIGRALLIGIVAGVILVPLSASFAWLLTSQGALCQLELVDLGLVFCLAVGSSLLGVSVSAFQATRFDPIENVVTSTY